MVKVLDKIYCKLEAVHSLLPSAGINRLVSQCVKRYDYIYINVCGKAFLEVCVYYWYLKCVYLYSQGRMLVNYIVKLHAQYHSEQLRKGFEGVYVMYCSL